MCNAYWRRIGSSLPFLLLIISLQSTVASPQRSNPGKSLFDYDRSIFFDLKEVSSRDDNGVTIRDINYTAFNAAHKRVDAYLVKPTGRGPFAGVLFFHWLGNVKSDRNEFLEEAIELAKQLANIPADKGVERVILPYPQTFLQQLLSGSNDNANTELERQRMVYASLPEDARRALRFMALMDRMKNGESMLLMPFDVRVK